MGEKTAIDYAARHKDMRSKMDSIATRDALIDTIKALGGPYVIETADDMLRLAAALRTDEFAAANRLLFLYLGLDLDDVEVAWTKKASTQKTVSGLPPEGDGNG